MEDGQSTVEAVAWSGSAPLADLSVGDELDLKVELAHWSQIAKLAAQPGIYLSALRKELPDGTRIYSDIIQIYGHCMFKLKVRAIVPAGAEDCRYWTPEEFQAKRARVFVDGVQINQAWYIDTRGGFVRTYDVMKFGLPTIAQEFAPADFPGREVEDMGNGLLSETIRGVVTLIPLKETK